MYVRLPDYYIDSHALFATFTETNVFNASGFFGMDASGHLTLSDAGSVVRATSALVLPKDKWIRLGFTVTKGATTGRLDAYIFTAERSVILAEHVFATNINTGANGVAFVDFGITNNGPYSYLMDRVAASTTPDIHSHMELVQN
jgi:hypothetical protein